MPGKETVLDGSYRPLSRPLYIFVKNSALRRPDAGGFVKFYLDNAAKFAEKAGYVAPRPDDTAANAGALAAATGGGPNAAAPAPAPVPVPAAKEGGP
jgi:phosphate transport system substrate-binding protein